MKLLASHVVMIIAGIFLARETRGGGTAEATVTAGSKQTPTTNSSLTDRPRAKWRSREYAQAWSAVRTARLTKPERIAVQRDLLKNWAEIDLHAAIEAALAESWVAEYKQMGSSAMLVPGGPLLDAMSESLAEDPDASWEMIHGEGFELAIGMLVSVWIDAVGKSDPFYLAGKLEMFEPYVRQRALTTCSNSVHQRPGYEVYDEFLKILTHYPAEIMSAEDLFHAATPRFFPEGATERLKALVLNTDPVDERMFRLHALNLGKQISGKSVGEIEAELAGLPAAAIGDVLFAAVTDDGNYSFPKPEKTMALIDFMIEGEAWGTVARGEVAQQIDRMASTDAQKVAVWAISLPIRRETGRLFESSVGPYIRNNLETAPDWIGQIPPGEWRDRAYVQYSQATMGFHDDTTKWEWAMARVSDPVLKAEAESRRAAWEKLKKN
ncbi:MAG: hypothetical protein V4819_22580 [Verrucomicrobiota bacterium]